MSNFSAAWLDLRTPADAAARDQGLARRFAAALPLHPKIIDLGAGTGANARALEPLVGGEWVLVDRDAALLARGGGFATIRLDLAAGWDALDALGADAVTAAAFFDLVSEDWLARFARWLAARRLPLYATLTVDGRRIWSPADPDDPAIAAAFRAHQRRDKGFGAALGPAAPDRLARLIAEHAYAVAVAASDWRLGPAERALIEAMVRGEARAAQAEGAAAAAWQRRRLDQAAAGLLQLTIGHRDLLALPAQTCEKG
jgi:hypothetical protein